MAAGRAGQAVRSGRSRRAARLAGAAAMAWLAGVGVALAAEPGGRPAPDFVLKSTTGANVRLSEYRGQTVLLGFWADWCGRCREQLDGLAALATRFADRDVVLLTVNLDTAGTAASEAANRLDVPVLRDADGAVARAYDLRDLPYTLIVDADGRVRSGFARAQAADFRELEAGLTRVLAD